MMMRSARSYTSRTIRASGPPARASGRPVRSLQTASACHRQYQPPDLQYEPQDRLLMPADCTRLQTTRTCASGPQEPRPAITSLWTASTSIQTASTSTLARACGRPVREPVGSPVRVFRPPVCASETASASLQTATEPPRLHMRACGRSVREPPDLQYVSTGCAPMVTLVRISSSFLFCADFVAQRTSASVWLHGPR